MIKIIPAVIAKSEKELEEKIKLVENQAEWIQLDIMDNVFVPNITINDPLKIARVLKKFPKINFEAHLMIKNPQDTIDKWIKSGCKRLIVHFESTNERELINLIKKVKQSKIEAGLAINPETPISAAQNPANLLDFVLFLSVHPGFAGQKFINSTLEKIKNFHKLHPNVKIGVDGGLNDKNVKRVIKAGAENLIFGSFILDSPNPLAAVGKLKNIINESCNSGFTLLELLVVIAAIGLLAAIVTVSINYARQRSNFAKIIADIDQISKAVELYNTALGKYPIDKTPIQTDGVGVSDTITDNNFDGIPENAPDIIPTYLPSWPKPPCRLENFQYDYDNVNDIPNYPDIQYVRIALKGSAQIGSGGGGIVIDPWYGHLTKCLYTNEPTGYCGDGINIDTLQDARFACK